MQQLQSHPVKGPYSQLFQAVRLLQQNLQTLPHFSGRPVGEGDGQDLPGLHPLLAHQVGDAAGQDPGLARARTCRHHHRSARGFDGAALRLVHSFLVRERPGREVLFCGWFLPGLLLCGRGLRRRARQIEQQGLPLELLALLVAEDPDGTELAVVPGQDLHRSGAHAPHPLGHQRLAAAGDFFGLYCAQNVQFRTQLNQQLFVDPPPPSCC